MQLLSIPEVPLPYPPLLSPPVTAVGVNIPPPCPDPLVLRVAPQQQNLARFTMYRLAVGQGGDLKLRGWQADAEHSESLQVQSPISPMIPCPLERTKLR